MKIKDLVLEAIEEGTADRDKAGNVSFELFGVKHSVRVTDAEIESYQSKMDAEAEQAEADYAEAESAMAAAKAVIQKHKKRKK